MQLLPFHSKKHSRPATEDDLSYFLAIREAWHQCCLTPAGRYPHAYALAHVQVESEDPIRAFINYEGDIIINPEIIEQKEKVFRKEACMTWAFRGVKKVRRYSKVKVKYTLLRKDSNSTKEVTEWVEGMPAFIFQHEIDHFNLKTLYKV